MYADIAVSQSVSRKFLRMSTKASKRNEFQEESYCLAYTETKLSICAEKSFPTVYNKLKTWIKLKT